MPLFKTTTEQRVRRTIISVDMLAAGLSASFVKAWLALSDQDKGVFELGELWKETHCATERSELVAAIKENIQP